MECSIRSCRKFEITCIFGIDWWINIYKPVHNLNGGCYSPLEISKIISGIKHEIYVNLDDFKFRVILPPNHDIYGRNPIRDVIGI